MRVSQAVACALLVSITILACYCGTVDAVKPIRRGAFSEYDESEFEGIDDMDIDIDADIAPEATADDIDEFDEVDAASQDAEAEADAADDDAVPTLKPTTAAPEKRTYEYEALALLGLFVYAVNYILGRRKNQDIAAAFSQTFQPIFERHFSETGIGAESGSLLIKQSQSSFRFVASGRRGCAALIADIDLAKRHDLVSVVTGFFSKEEDTLLIDIPVNANEMEPFVIAVVKNSLAKAFHRDSPDVAAFAKVKSKSVVSEDYTVISDATNDFVNRVLSPEGKQAIVDCSKYLNVLHLTDDLRPGNTTPGGMTKNTIRMQIKLPSAAKMSDITPLIELSLFLVDSVTSARLDKPARRKAVQLRRDFAAAAANDREAREERARKLREEKAAREEEKYKKMTPAQRQRADEARAAKRRKKRMGGRMKMKAM